MPALRAKRFRGVFDIAIGRVRFGRFLAHWRCVGLAQIVPGEFMSGRILIVGGVAFKQMPGCRIVRNCEPEHKDLCVRDRTDNKRLSKGPVCCLERKAAGG